MGAIEDFVTKCRRKLVDTSMRNRLLNYRPGARSGSVEIVGEHPVAVWDSVVSARRAMVFRGRPDDDPGAEGGPPSLLPQVEATTGGGLGLGEAVADADAFEGSIAVATSAKHRDNFLDTRIAASVLATKLLRLSDTARSTLEEQGVETLFLALGFLRFFEAESSDVERRAALLLVPVDLEREGRDRWRVRMRDDDPIVNPALVEYLKAQHGLSIPDLPETLEDFSSLAWYREVQRLVSTKPRWRVSADCILGIFSFQKFVMHEDLKRHVGNLARHEVIEQLATRSGGGGGRPQLPPEVTSLDLDRDCPVENTPLVVDADSSQVRALAAVSRGHHMVIEGPPGTGKSQTIANLVASALFAGKTVLFVAEKQAALNVVFDRLKKCGLGDFCFEVHSTKANKTAVLKELGRSLDASLARHPVASFDAARLAGVREDLTRYARAVHEVLAPLSASAYGVIGRLAALSSAPEVRVMVKTDAVSGEELSRTLELLARVSAAATRVGDPDAHPWRDASKESLDLDAREGVEASLQALQALIPEVESGLTAATQEFGMSTDPTVSGVPAFVELAAVLDRCPGVETIIAADAAWATTGFRDATEVVARGRALAKAESEAAECFRDAANVASIASAAEVAQRHANRRLRWLSPSWRRARRELRGATREAAWHGASKAAGDVRAALAAATERVALDSDACAAARFGARWRGANSNWNELDQCSNWLRDFHDVVAKHSISSPIFDVVTAPRPRTEALQRAADLCQRLLTTWRELGKVVGWPQAYLEDASVRAICQRARVLLAAPLAYREWFDFRSLREEAARTVAAPVVREADDRRLAWGDVPRAFARRFYERWLDARAETTPVLRRFLGESHAAKIEEFRELDRRILDYHRQTLAAQLRARAQSQLQEQSLAQDVRFLRDQLARQRGHKPLRQLLKGACGAIQALKPCFLMSPMTVAQGLDPEKHRFDLVVFDEASQMTPEDALGAILRGRQVVVVGDPKQLPPTNFFAVQSGQVEANDSEEGAEFDDLDSVLELATASGFYGTTLRWHYRSRHESLIAYSNRNFYNDRPLFTFPGADIDRRVRGLRFEFVAEGRYEGLGVNRAEAQRVVGEVVRHAREHPTLSLGVGTFSLAQQLAVQDELERRRRDEPWLEEFLSLDKPEPFFVKNLESIQGDERDVVILSITYGPGADGKIRHNFGPINGQNGWRRLNVLTTRARERMLVFSSMHADDIDLTRAQSHGAALMRAFLRYAESDVLEGNPVVEASADAESPFEAEVAAALVRAGMRIQPQVGVAGYRIDMGVLDADVPGRFVCGVECDGVAYHSAESARDRDRLREEVLRRLGWTLHRVWSLDWWHDRKGQTDRLLRLIERSKVEAARNGTVPIRGANLDTEPAGSAGPAAGDATSRVPDATVRTEVRPVEFAPYRMAITRPRSGGIASADSATVAGVMERVLHEEGPLHADDLRARTLQAFGQSREGSRIAYSLDEGLGALRSRPGVETDGQSWRASGASAAARKRGGTAIPPDRIPSWEYEAGVVAVLQGNEALPEDDLVAAVRDAFGYGAASAALRAGVLDAVRRLTKAGTVGIGSGGLRLVVHGRS